jgi:succinate-semialdehyde dehydrogenase/glutarate-semialdehyde dehydrogenase
MTAAKGVTHRMGYTIRVPKGVICAITPFNSPLNTLAHKVAPALAGGNAVIVKPSTYTPLSAVAFCKVLIDAGLPAELLSLVYGPSHTVARRLLAHPKVAYYAFTGSTRVGREIQQAAGLRGTQLELGSIASTIVCSDADLERALPKIVNAGYRKAGQVCTSVQRLFVARSLSETFTKRFVSAVKALPAGDPADPKTVVGPMISEEHAIRAADWIQAAVAQGATLLCGGGRKGTVLEPTILSGVKSDMKVVCEEVFAPVVCLIEFDTLDEAITAANDSPYGLAVGIFTNDLRAAFQAAGSLNFGGIHINEASSARVDVMPFGGVKASGYGRELSEEGIREFINVKGIRVAG